MTKPSISLQEIIDLLQKMESRGACIKGLKFDQQVTANASLGLLQNGHIIIEVDYIWRVRDD